MSDFKPYIPASTKIAEFTPGPVIAGILLGIVFGASSLYLGLKVGMTVSASVPIAVLSVTLFRAISKTFKLRQATILENNIVQTTGSAGESIAFGVSVTMPALMILGYDMDISRVMTAAVLGGLLGVLLMIPLRRALIVKEHGKLIYPEGTACAEVLLAGERGGTTARTVFGGFFAGLIYKFCNSGLNLWRGDISYPFRSFPGAAVSAEVSPELLGVGYIIGPRIGGVMIAGGILSSLVLIPMIKFFGSGWAEPLFPATTLIRDMDIHDIWRNYVLYIGAGAVASGGIIALVQSLPIIIRGAKEGLRGIGSSQQRGDEKEVPRTDRDLPLGFAMIGATVIVALIWAIPTFHMTLPGAFLMVLFSFLFVTVSSRLTGEIGSSSNPISGMTVATLLFTSLLFLAMGWTEPQYRVTALCVAAIVCVAASNAGTTSQDLKTGYLLGATPKYQQIGLLIGAFTSALVIGYTLNLLNDASTIYSKKAIKSPVTVDAGSLKETSLVHDPVYSDDRQEYKVLRIQEHSASGPLANIPIGKYLVAENGALTYLVDPGINGVLTARDDGTKVQKFEAPKARLMSLIIDGILTQKLPWTLVLLGVAIAIVLELCGIASLPFAVGVYLPMSVSAPIFIGGCLRWLVEKIKKAPSSESHAETETGAGVLFSSGLIAGGSIAGILLALVAMNGDVSKAMDFSGKVGESGEWIALAAFAGLCALLTTKALAKAR